MFFLALISYFLWCLATLRQSMQMAANPALMQEMMRNNDRAMANLSNRPEGFNALRRAYEVFSTCIRPLFF